MSAAFRLPPAAWAQVIYVAGDRVTSDLMAKPFSMGRNLLNVHSKKYMDADPDLKPAKVLRPVPTSTNLLVYYEYTVV